MNKKLQLVSLLTLILLPTLGLLMSPEHVTPIDNQKDIPVKKIIRNPYYETFVAQFEQKLDSAFNKNGTPGAAIAIVIDSTTYLLKSYGVKTSGGNDPIDIETKFRLASVSKGFASVLAGLYVDKGLMDWNDPIVKYINNFSAEPLTYTDSISISHILSHTAGFPYQAYSTLIEDGIVRDSLFSALRKVKLSRTPGEIHSYQNVAYDLIEPVLESVTYTSFNDLMKQNIFEPLGMTHASMTYEEMQGSTNRSSPHLSNGRKYIPVSLSPDYYNVAAAGGINASIKDMSMWMKALLGYKDDVIPKSVLKEVFTPRIRTGVRNYGFSSFERPRKGNYGYGWRIVEYPNDTLVYHGGYANGFKSGIALNPNKKIAICILTNAPGTFSSKMLVEFFKTYNEFEGEIKDWQITKQMPELLTKPRFKVYSERNDSTAIRDLFF